MATRHSKGAQGYRIVINKMEINEIQLCQGKAQFDQIPFNGENYFFKRGRQSPFHFEVTLKLNILFGEFLATRAGSGNSECSSSLPIYRKQFEFLSDPNASF